MSPHITQNILLYVLMPLWLAAGIADWFCNRQAGIKQATSLKSVKGSFIHLMTFAAVGVPLLACIFLQINATIIALVLVAFIVHETTALWDASDDAATARKGTSIEQHIRGFLEMLPLMGIVTICGLHWEQFGALFGQGPQAPDFGLHRKLAALPMPYIASLLSAIFFLEALPYLEASLRGMRVHSLWSALPTTGNRLRSSAKVNHVWQIGQ